MAYTVTHLGVGWATYMDIAYHISVFMNTEDIFCHFRTDPRFPTVRGVMRRGMTLEGLKEFVIAQVFPPHFHSIA